LLCEAANLVSPVTETPCCPAADPDTCVAQDADGPHEQATRPTEQVPASLVMGLVAATTTAIFGYYYCARRNAKAKKTSGVVYLAQDPAADESRDVPHHFPGSELKPLRRALPDREEIERQRERERRHRDIAKRETRKSTAMARESSRKAQSTAFHEPKRSQRQQAGRNRTVATRTREGAIASSHEQPWAGGLDGDPFDVARALIRKGERGAQLQEAVKKLVEEERMEEAQTVFVLARKTALQESGMFFDPSAAQDDFLAALSNLRKDNREKPGREQKARQRASVPLPTKHTPKARVGGEMAVPLPDDDEPTARRASRLRRAVQRSGQAHLDGSPPRVDVLPGLLSAGSQNTPSPESSAGKPSRLVDRSALELMSKFGSRPQ